MKKEKRKMKKTLRIIIMMIITIMIIGGTNITNAFSFNAGVSSDEKLVAGQEVKISLSLSDINMDEGIYSIQVKKIVVGDAFEPISQSNFSSNTCMPTYTNGGLVLMSGTPIKNSGEVVTLTLKVKEGISAKSDTVRFENIVASSGSNTGDISAGTKTITIEANGNNSESSSENNKEETDKNGNNSEDNTGKTDGNNGGYNTDKTDVNNSGNDTGKTDVNGNNSEKNIGKTNGQNTYNTKTGKNSKESLPKKLPATGEKSILIILSIVAIAGIAVIYYIRYKNIKSKR